MPSPSYQQALNTIASALHASLELALEKINPLIKSNVTEETALADGDFVSLLDTFSGELALGKVAKDAWEMACRKHQFKGKAIPASHCPVTLGRVKSLRDHAKDIHKASSGKISAVAAEKLLHKHSGLIPPTGFISALRATVLGNYTIWATFDAVDNANNPFAQLPRTHGAICAALGLGHFSPSDTIIALSWNHVKAGAPLLHRPTIADAETNPYFRVHPDAKQLYGWTAPLPHAQAMQAQPELVMKKTDCAGLLFPFYVVQA